MNPSQTKISLGPASHTSDKLPCAHVSVLVALVVLFVHGPRLGLAICQDKPAQPAATAAPL